MPIDDHVLASFNWPRHKRAHGALLGRYMMIRLLMNLMAVAFILASLVMVLDIVELLRISATHDVPLKSLISLSLLKLPTLLLELLPFIVLLAVLVFLHSLNRRYELVALKAAGLPARRFLLAPFVLIALLGAFSLLVVSPVAATLMKKYERTYAAYFPERSQGVLTSGGSLWLKQDEGGYRFFIHAREIARDNIGLSDATILSFNADGNFAMRMDAKNMTLHDGAWAMKDVFIMKPNAMVTFEPRLRLPTSLTKQDIITGFLPPETMSLWELGRYTKILEKSGWPSGEYATTYHRLLALPAFLMAMFILAVPVALRFVRGAGLATSLGSGVGLGFAFYLLGNLMASYGLAGRLDVIVAAWAPVVVAVLFGVGLLILLREE